MTGLLFALFLTPSLQAQQSHTEIGNLVMENIPAVPGDLKDRMNQYQQVRGASPSTWTASGDGMLITTRFAETNQIHLITKPGGARKQLTFFNEPVGGGSFCPNPAYNGFMFTKDVGGNEFRQLYWFDLKAGSWEMISDGGRTQNSNVLWSEDGTQFIYTSTRRNGKDYDLYLSSMTKPKEAKRILENTGSWFPTDWSVDGGKVIVVNRLSINRSYLHVLDLASGKLQQINPSKEEISYAGGLWTADGNGIFYISDEGSEFRHLRYYDLATRKSQVITRDINWDIEDIIINKERSRIVFAANENGIFRLYELDTRTKKYAPLPGLPVALNMPARFHPDGKVFSLTINSPKSSSDAYTYNLETRELSQWTDSEVGGLPTSSFNAPELISFETFDRVDDKPRMIPAFYYKPVKATGRVPVVINIHGGPEGQALPSFNAFRSYLTNELGVAVIEPNVRGSSGYGKTYLKLDNGMKREESVKDIGSLLDWIAKQPDLDASRVAVYGGSYGGYMVLSSMVHFNDRLACGIDVVGISNFVTFLKNTEDYRKDLRRVEYGDERVPEMNAFLEGISPSNHVDKITKPLFIIQGLNDPRVPASESEQMKKKLMEKDRDVWYLLAKDEGHGFRKKENYTFQQLAIVMFLEKHLGLK